MYRVGTVVLCDDDTERAQYWRDELERIGIGAQQILALSKSDVGQCLRELGERRKAIRTGSRGLKEYGGSVIDTAEVLVIDFDLFGIEIESQIVTGEEFAYLARAYSHANTVVVINQYGQNRFDLTLRQDAYSHADVNVGSEQIVNPGLWKSPFEGYRPWHWPLLTCETEKYKRRVKKVRENLQTSVLELLGFRRSDNGMPENLSRQALSAFQGNAASGPDEIWSITCRDFVCKTGVWVPQREGEDLSKHDDIVARLAAAYLRKWLEAVLLPSQDVLIDAAHLAERMPWLLDGDAAEVSVWNSVTSLEEVRGLRRDLLTHQFAAVDWLSRPVFWWGQIVEDENLSVPPQGWDPSRVPELIFREDVSNFGPRAESRQFVADIEGLADTRYVVDPGTMQAEGARDPNRVEYSPGVRFAM
jgi:hypothetical protein